MSIRSIRTGTSDQLADDPAVFDFAAKMVVLILVAHQSNLSYLLLSEFVLPVEGHVAAVALERPLSRVEHLVTADVVRPRELLAADVALVAVVLLGQTANK